MSDFCFWVSTLVKPDDMLKVGLYNWASTLAKFNNILKVGVCYLANTLTNINDEAADNIIRQKLIVSNQLYNSSSLGDNWE